MKAPLSLALAAAFWLAPSAHAATAMSGEGAPIIPIATDADYARLVEQTVRIYIVPAYRDLVDASARLSTTVREYCAAPDPRRREGLDAAFLDTLKVWAGVDFMHFGPMGSEGRYERFAFWPDVHGTGARQLRQMLVSGDMKLADPVAMSRQSAAVQGLPALEQLFYSGSKALVSADAPDDYRCALSGAIAENMRTIADDALSGWTASNGWSWLLENPSDSNPVYRTHKEAATEILKAALTGLEQMRDQRLLPAVGETPGAANANRAPYHLSGHTMAYLQAGASALELFVGSTGLLEMLPEDQDGYAASALFEFDNLNNALGDAGSDIAAALADEKTRSKLLYATIVLDSLRDLFELHIAVAAGLMPGFNSLDGD